MYDFSVFTSNIVAKQQRKMSALLPLIKQHGCPAFKVRLTNGLEQVYVVPNRGLADAMLQETKNSIGFSLVSLYGAGEPLAFDKDHEHLKPWAENVGTKELLDTKPIWIRNWHLWFRINKTLYNNSLARVVTFPYPHHFHMEKWSTTPIDKNYPYSWMNLIIEPIFFFPKELSIVLNMVMGSLDRDTYNRIAQLPKEYTSQWDDVLAFSQPQHRADTHHHLTVHDKILNPSNRTSYQLPTHKFSVTASSTEAANIEKANCLNLAFLLGEPKFIEAVQQKIDIETASVVAGIGKFLNLDREDRYLAENQAPKQCYSAYNMGILLSKLLSVSPLIFLNGGLPTQFVQNSDVIDFNIPFKKLGVDSGLASLIENRSNRIKL
jgi:hypothetical protein